MVSPKRNRPKLRVSDAGSLRVILCYKKPPSPGSGHTGLGNSCRNTSNVLNQNGIRSEVWPIAGADDLEVQLKSPRGLGVTHVAIGAPFVPADWMQRLSQEFPLIKFVVVSHSNVGFLQAEPAAIRLMRAYTDVAVVEHNFHAAGNNNRLVEAMNNAYGRYIMYLPNLYDLASTPPMRGNTATGNTLRIGSFGALRVQKNFTSAAWAAMAIARWERMNLEFYINSGRDDGNGNVVRNAIAATTENLPWVTLIDVPWQTPLDFRRTVSGLHLLIQPSYTETYSVVTADAIAEGVPVVVTEAVDWAPDDWKAASDDVTDIARVGQRLLHNPFAAQDGYDALLEYNDEGLYYWWEFIKP